MPACLCNYPLFYDLFSCDMGELMPTPQDIEKAKEFMDMANRQAATTGNHCDLREWLKLRRKYLDMLKGKEK